MTLTLKQRLFVVFIYLTLISSIGYYFTDDWEFFIDTNHRLNVVFIAVALTLILGSYISEPFYSKPIDALTRWVALFLFVEGLNSKDCLHFYPFWRYAALSFSGIALLLIIIHGLFPRSQRWQKVAVDLVCKISRPEIVFSLLYFDIVISFFTGYSPELPVLIGFGFLLLINKPIIYVTELLSKIVTTWKNSSNAIPIGSVIGYDSSDFYKSEIASLRLTGSGLKGKLVFLDIQGKGLIGIIVEERQLLGKQWAYVFSLRDSNGDLIVINPKSYDPLSGEKSIFLSSDQLYLVSLTSLSQTTQDSIKQSLIYNRFEDLVGLVTTGSTINQIKFHTLFDSIFLNTKGIGEGTITETRIGNTDVLYQIIDARTTEENLEFKDSHGLTIGTAQKLGKYSTATNELNTVKWLPEIYSPIFLLNPQAVAYDPINFIGRLPGTNYGIPIKYPHELVTHNCAILGILGIGKSCLTFEILSKLISTTQVKIFCIDLTNQYAKELRKYIDPALIQIEIPAASRTHLRQNNPDGNPDNPSSWGNEELYRTTLRTDFGDFIASNNRVLILNPDIHIVSKAGGQFKIQHKVDLSPSEKTRIISEVLLTTARNNGETEEARYLMVMEEAHSLVPEWNSVANDGDKNSTNGIAKVVLQGRKYGFGSMVIAQRTANISKSILNQCNTIFALRVFDDTGKQFLENYIGSEYSNLLPTLEERHAIAIGKALKLKQPLIVALNSRDDVMLPVAPLPPGQPNP